MAENRWSQIASNYAGVASPGAPAPGGYTGGVRGFAGQQYTANREAMWNRVRPQWEEYQKRNRAAIKAALAAAQAFANRQYPEYGSSPSMPSGGGGGSSPPPSIAEVSQYRPGEMYYSERQHFGAPEEWYGRGGPPDDSGKWVFAGSPTGDNINQWKYTG